MDKTNKVKQLIKLTGCNLKDFSKKADIPYTTLRSMLERGIDNASVNNVIKICNALNISVESLYEEDHLSISKEDKYFLKKLNNLDSEDKNKVIEYIDDLSNSVKYLGGIAAHNDYANDPEQQELMREDLNDL